MGKRKYFHRKTYTDLVKKHGKEGLMKVAWYNVSSELYFQEVWNVITFLEKEGIEYAIPRQAIPFAQGVFSKRKTRKMKGKNIFFKKAFKPSETWVWIAKKDHTHDLFIKSTQKRLNNGIVPYTL